MDQYELTELYQPGDIDLSLGHANLKQKVKKMTYILSDAENASEITISKGGMESLVDRKIGADEWEEFCRDWDYLHDIYEAAADAFERSATNTPGSPPIP